MGYVKTTARVKTGEAWKKVEAESERERVSHTLSVTSDFPCALVRFDVDISRPPAWGDANLSDKTADGPLANPLEGKTVPRVRRGTAERDGEPGLGGVPGKGGGKGVHGGSETGVERKGVGRPPGRFLGAQLIGAPTTPTLNRRRRRLIRMKQHGIPL